MKGPTEEGFSIFYHVVLVWLQQYVPQERGRSILGRFVRDYGRDAVLLAFDRTLEANPRPVDPYTYFTKLVSSNDKMLGDAQTAWNTVVRLANNCAVAQSQASLSINLAVAAIGGWQKIGFADKKTFGSLRGQFVQVFQEQNGKQTTTNAP